MTSEDAQAIVNAINNLGRTISLAIVGLEILIVGWTVYSIWGKQK